MGQAIELIKNNDNIMIFVHAGIGIIAYNIILLIVRCLIVKRSLDSRTTKKRLNYVKVFEKFVDALIYVPTFVFGIVNYVMGVDKIGLTNEFMISGLILLVYTFFNKIFNIPNVSSD